MDDRTLDVLRMVNAGEVTWQRRGRGRTVKVWSSEDDWSPMPTDERAALAELVAQGLATWAPGVGLYYRGPVEMTAAGRRALADARGAR